jgi:hypothetical protein
MKINIDELMQRYLDNVDKDVFDGVTVSTTKNTKKAQFGITTLTFQMGYEDHVMEGTFIIVERESSDGSKRSENITLLNNRDHGVIFNKFCTNACDDSILYISRYLENMVRGWKGLEVNIPEKKNKKPNTFKKKETSDNKNTENSDKNADSNTNREKQNTKNKQSAAINKLNKAKQKLGE